MKILTLSYEFPPLGGGGAKVVYGLTKELVKLGHKVDLVTMGFRGLPKFEKINGVNVHRVPCVRTKESACYTPELASYIFTAIPFALKLIRQKPYDLNHTHFIFPDGFISYILKKLTGLPYVITAHGSDVPGYNPNRFKKLHKLLLPFWRKITGSSNEIICPSEWLKALVLHAKPRIKVTVIPNGIDLDKFGSNGAKKKRILVVSRMFERKGVQYFLKSLEGLDLPYEINIVGEGPYLGALEQSARELSVKVKFLGWFDNASRELKELYESSQIFVFPSEVENFPIVLLEAMASGMSIITTRGTSCVEVVGDAALLVEPRNPMAIREALVKLTNDEALCKTLGRQARRRFENNFSWDILISKYDDLFRRCATINDPSSRELTDD